MKTILFSLALGLCCACSHDDANKSTSNSGVHAAGSSSPTTAMDQGNNEADLNLVQAVRRALMDDSALSTMAKNVTAVAKEGTVTLKGTLASQAEKSQVESCVLKVAGVHRVQNDITVKPN